MYSGTEIDFGNVIKHLKIGPWVHSSLAEHDIVIKSGDGSGSAYTLGGRDSYFSIGRGGWW